MVGESFPYAGYDDFTNIHTMMLFLGNSNLLVSSYVFVDFLNGLETFWCLYIKASFPLICYFFGIFGDSFNYNLLANKIIPVIPFFTLLFGDILCPVRSLPVS